MPNEKVRQREFGVFRGIHDNYPKYVLSLDTMDFSQEGVVHRNLLDFLLDDDDLDPRW